MHLPFSFSSLSPVLVDAPSVVAAALSGVPEGAAGCDVVDGSGVAAGSEAGASAAPGAGSFPWRTRVQQVEQKGDDRDDMRHEHRTSRGGRSLGLKMAVTSGSRRVHTRNRSRQNHPSPKHEDRHTLFLGSRRLFLL